MPDEPLRVALDATPLLGTRTGVATFCLGALSGLGARGDMDVGAYAVSWRRRGGIVGQLPPGVGAIGRPMPARPLHAAWRRGPLPPAEWLVGGMDVVHGTNFVVPPARRAARVVTVHDLTALRFPQMCESASLGFPDQVRRAVAHGAWVHTPSEWVAAEVVELLGVDPSRVRAVYHGAEPPGGTPARDSTGAPRDLSGTPARDSTGAPRDLSGTPARDSTGAVPKRIGAGAPPDRCPDQVREAPGPPGCAQLLVGVGRYVLALGTVEPRKDLVGLVRAFGQLAGDRPDVALVIAGADRWGAPGLDAAVEACAFRGRVVRLGYVSQAHRDQLLAGASALAYPSVYEGFGLPPLEAMVRGVPVVATRAGALPEVLGDGADLVGVGEPVELAGALARLLDDDCAAAELAARGRRRAAQFSWERCADGLARLYRDAVSEQRA